MMRFYGMKYLLIIFISLFPAGVFSQYKQVDLTDAERKQGILRHYQVVGEYASGHLFILKNNRFRYEDYTCLSSVYSEGQYVESGDEIIMTSSLQAGTLPVSIEYRQPKDSTDRFVKRIAIVRDLDGRDVSDAIVYINNDSNSCILGDMMCWQEPERIDSIKVVLSKNLFSPWVKVAKTPGLIQIRIHTKGELWKYVIYNARFRKKGKELEGLK